MPRPGGLQSAHVLAGRLAAGGEHVVTGGDMKRVLRPVERRLLGWLARPYSCSRVIASASWSVCITHDAPTLELCTTLSVPASMTATSPSARALRDLTPFGSAAAFEQHRNKLARGFVALPSSGGLIPATSPGSLAGAS